MKCALPLMALLLAMPTAAQERAVLQGRTLDYTSDAPVPEARLELRDSRGRGVAFATSDSVGGFRFDRVVPGDYTLRATAAGFRDVETPSFAAHAGVPVDVVVRMGIDVVPLAPLEVVTRAPPLHRNVALSGFLERSTRRVGGTFILREELEQREPRQVSDLLRTVGSFTVFDGQGGRSMGGTIFNNRAQCEPAVYLDGQLISNRPGMNAFNAANSVHWSSLEGVEVYSGAGTVPAQFAGSRARCGVIAMWSRR
jgi:hypothetical protein